MRSRSILLLLFLLSVPMYAQTEIACCQRGTSGGGSGTVTSVGLTAPAELSIANSPITSSGTLALTWGTQLTNRVFASPCGTTGTPTFRALCSSDIPATIAANTSGNAATATALAVNPSPCTAQFVRDIAANGTLTCESISDADVPNTITINNATTATALQTARTIGGTSFDGTANIVPATATNVSDGDKGDITVSSGAWDIDANTVGASELAATSVTAGTCTACDLTIDADGRITAKASGSVGGAPFSDASALVANASDATKQIAFDASGVTTGNTVTFKGSGTSGSPTFHSLVYSATTGSIVYVRPTGTSGTGITIRSTGDIESDFNASASLGSTDHPWRRAYISYGGVQGSWSKALTDATATAFASLAVASNTQAAGKLLYAIEVVDAGGEMQVEFGEVPFVATNKAGTITVAVGTKSNVVQQATSGTLAITFDSTTTSGSFSLRANSDTSLTATTHRIDYRFDMPIITVVTAL